MRRDIEPSALREAMPLSVSLIEGTVHVREWSYPVFVDSLGLSPPALSWATAGGRKVFPKIGG